MQNLKVSLVQASLIWEDKTANIRNFEHLLESVVDADIIVLPEMFNTGFSMNSSTLAEPFTNSPSLEWLKQKSKEKNAAIYTSLMIQEKDNFFNRGVFVTPRGDLSVYDKIKLFSMAREDQYFTAGKKETIVEYLGWKIKLQICYDLRFPEISRNSNSLKGEPYDLLIYTANWPEKRVEHWKTLLAARAIENQAYVCGVNRSGMDGTGLNHTGDSMIMSPLGERLCHLSQPNSCITFDLDQYALNETREKLPFLGNI